jgi:hypothetical protein
MANRNMPEKFITTFEKDKKAFDKLHLDFLKSESTAHLGTDDKIKANNKVHTDLMSMFFDGQEIFRKDETLKKEFTFEQVLLLITGGGVAGVKGYVTIDGTVKPIEKATITISKIDKEATTDIDGKYEILQVAADTYTIKISASGYDTKTIVDFEIKTGTVSNLNVALKPTTQP